MGLTEAQRADRKNHLGSSDVPQLMGFSPFGNAYDLWLEKTGRVQPKEKTQGYITAGNLLEQPLVKWLGIYLQETILDKAEDLERKIEGTPIVVHMDGIVESTGLPVEAKTDGVDHPVQGCWGEVGTDEVTEYTCIQGHCHIMALECNMCHVPTFIGGRGFGYFFVKRDNKIVELIKRKTNNFWEENVLKDVPPENIAPSLTMAKRIQRRIAIDAVELDAEKVQAWIDAKEAATAAVKAKEFHHAGILADLDGVETGTCSLGDITNFEQSRRGIDTKALKAELPDIHEKYYRTGEPYPVLRLKKRK